MSRYLTKQEIIQIHQESLRLFGGAAGLINEAGLEAAIARPQSGYYQNVVEEAAALFESLSQNHPFQDGNKRTALAATAIFLRLNGYKVVFDDLSAYQYLIRLYEQHKVNKIELEHWLRSIIRKV